MDADFTFALAGVIKRKRKSIGATQEQLAAKSDLHVNYVSGLERGKYNVTVVKLRDIAVALGTTVSALVEEAESELKGEDLRS